MVASIRRHTPCFVVGPSEVRPRISVELHLFPKVPPLIWLALRPLRDHFSAVCVRGRSLVVCTNAGAPPTGPDLRPHCRNRAGASRSSPGPKTNQSDKLKILKELTERWSLHLAQSNFGYTPGYFGEHGIPGYTRDISGNTGYISMSQNFSLMMGVPYFRTTMRRRQARLIPRKKLAKVGSPIKNESEAEIQAQIETEIKDCLFMCGRGPCAF